MIYDAYLLLQTTNSKPLYSYYLSGYQDSNLGPPAPKAGALTGLRYTPFARNTQSNFDWISAEREALEPVLSQNITQSQIPINNQLITIIIKSKYYRISLAIPIFGCIFGCRISNTPSHEHQTKHHFCT